MWAEELQHLKLDVKNENPQHVKKNTSYPQNTLPEIILMWCFPFKHTNWNGPKND